MKYIDYKNRKYKKIHWEIAKFYSYLHPIKHEKGIKISEKDRILLVYPRRIGDCVMAIPMLKALKLHCKYLAIAGPKYFMDLLNDQELYDKFYCFDECAGPVSGREWLSNKESIKKTLNSIKTENFDIAIEPFGDLWATLFMRLCNAKYYVGVDYGNLSMLLSSSAVYDDDAHITDITCGVVEHLGISIPSEKRKPMIVSSGKWEKEHIRIKNELKLNNKFVLGVHCGASLKIKKWPYFSNLIKICKENNKNIFLVLFCVPEDVEEVDAIVKDSKLQVGEYLIVKTGFRHYVDMLNMCNYIISNDSSCGHLSIAQGIDTAVIYGPYLPLMGTPRGVGDLCIVSKNLSCKPCSRMECMYGEDIRCLNQISANEVYEIIKTHISTFSKEC